MLRLLSLSCFLLSTFLLTAQKQTFNKHSFGFGINQGLFATPEKQSALGSQYVQPADQAYVTGLHFDHNSAIASWFMLRTGLDFNISGFYRDYPSGGLWRRNINAKSGRISPLHLYFVTEKRITHFMPELRSIL